MRIGIIFTAYNQEDYVLDSLHPWLQAKEKNLGGHYYEINAVSLPFKEYKDIGIKNDKTTNILLKYERDGIDHVFMEPQYIQEHEARNLCLEAFKDSNLDYVWMVDGDEFYTEEEILAITEYIQKDKFLAWYKVCLRNYVFDTTQFLGEPFAPPRIYKVNVGKWKLNLFTWDNDIGYINNNGEQISHTNLGNKIVPASLAWVKHFTWMNNDQSRMKIEYQHKHFGGICSYKWNYETNNLEFNDEYYTKYNLSKPKIFKE